MRILSMNNNPKFNKKKIIVILLSLFCLSACQKKQSEEIYILYTNDVASEVYGNIGYAGVKGYKDYLKSEHQYVSLVDAGDYFDGDFSRASLGSSIVEIMNAVGYDVAVLGNQEFSIGLQSLAENIAKSNFDYVSCNLKYLGSGQNPLKNVKPYVIKNMGRQRSLISVLQPRRH